MQIRVKSKVIEIYIACIQLLNLLINNNINQFYILKAEVFCTKEGPYDILNTRTNNACGDCLLEEYYIVIKYLHLTKYKSCAIRSFKLEF